MAARKTMKETSKQKIWPWLLPPYIGVLATAFIVSRIDHRELESHWTFLLGLLLVVPFTSIQYLITSKRVSILKGVLLGVIGPAFVWLISGALFGLIFER